VRPEQEQHLFAEDAHSTRARLSDRHAHEDVVSRDSELEVAPAGQKLGVVRAIDFDLALSVNGLTRERGVVEANQARSPEGASGLSG
jgi:hypothetical protein